MTALGTMKGAAMKLGQVMSFLDVGLVPEEFREEFQAKLAELMIEHEVGVTLRPVKVPKLDSDYFEG